MGITYKCKVCNKKVEFPSTPNIETDRWERLAHAIYTVKANEGVCDSKCFEEWIKNEN